MDQKGDKSTRDLLIEVVHNDMAFAREFATLARSNYDQGKIDEGNLARLQAMKYCFKAHESVIRIAEDDRKSDLEELEKLRAMITLLSAQPGDPQTSTATPPHEERPKQSAPKIFQRWKFWRN